MTGTRRGMPVFSILFPSLFSITITSTVLAMFTVLSVVPRRRTVSRATFVVVVLFKFSLNNEWLACRCGWSERIPRVDAESTVYPASNTVLSSKVPFVGLRGVVVLGHRGEG